MKKKILIVDDNPNIHEDFKRILNSKATTPLDNMEELLFGKNLTSTVDALAEIQMNSAYQGQEALEKIQEALKNKKPYALAFVDIRMPPGWDGIKTIKKLWELDPNLQVVICTAYSDYSWHDMFNELNRSENFLILKKPFDVIEARQMAIALTKKWEYKLRTEDKVTNLETIIMERTRELNDALTLAKNINTLKNEFLGNVSHELRTPLQSIIGFAELMYHGKADRKKYRDYYHYILSDARLLLQMITDMIDMSSLESRCIEFKPEQINSEQMIKEMQEVFIHLLTEKKLNFSYKVDPSLTTIVTDPNKFKQILRHYLSNAIKFTPSGGNINIKITPVESDHFQIAVSDTGIGIKKEEIKKLFHPFQQLDQSNTKNFHGIGLGLALAKRIVEFQGGEVKVESKPGKGSTFYAVLPRENK